MSFLSVEHGKLAYWSDFAFYSVVVAGLSGWVAFVSPRGGGIESTALVLLGLASWSLIEYLIHRFVLHGIQPFSGWHERHHSRPAALVSAPTVLSATLLAALVFLPTLALGGLRTSSALSLGVLSGYLVYSVVHHATHHWRADSAWSKRRKLWHAMHHRDAADGCCYGVTSRLWDHVFGTALRRPKGYHTEEQPIGFYSTGDRIKAWGGAGAFWGGIWGLLLAPAVFFILGLGLIAMAGPVVAALVGALEGAVVVGGVSALGAALSQLGVPVDQVLRYQTAIKVDKYVLMVHGSPGDATVARNILSGYTTLDAA